MKRRIESVRLRGERFTGRRRRAFTLVELLVVIAIIGMLMALLIPAVQMAREAARRSTCSNNQKNIGLAITNFATSRNRMPAGFSAHPQTPTGATGGFGCMGWVPDLLPYLEQKPIYDRIQTVNLVTYPTALTDLSVLKIDGHLAILTCPSRSATDTPAPNSYAVNAGMSDYYEVGRPLDFQPNGVFFDHYLTDFPTANQHGPRVTTDMSYISDHDGTSHTVLFSENVDAADWIGPLFQSPAKNAPAPAQTWGQGIVWRLDSNDTSQAYGPIYPNYPFFLNRDLDTLNRAFNASFQKSDAYTAKPTSAHSGGFLLTMVGGNTLFVNEDIDYRVYIMAMAPWSSPLENRNPETPPPNNLVPYPTTWMDATGTSLVPVTEADFTK
jgi:prepilin-type N-terminal cleavage/methylation domain-containing protein